MSPRKRSDERGVNPECRNAECRNAECKNATLFSGLLGPAAGKLSTSVAPFRPRYWRFSARTRESLTSATLTTPLARRGASRTSQRAIPGADRRLPSPFATSTRSLLAMMAVAVRERLVRPDDLLDQLVTNHVAFIEVHERDAVDPAHHFHGLG